MQDEEEKEKWMKWIKGEWTKWQVEKKEERTEKCKWKENDESARREWKSFEGLILKIIKE